MTLSGCVGASSGFFVKHCNAIKLAINQTSPPCGGGRDSWRKARTAQRIKRRGGRGCCCSMAATAGHPTRDLVRGSRKCVGIGPSWNFLHKTDVESVERFGSYLMLSNSRYVKAFEEAHSFQETPVIPNINAEIVVWKQSTSVWFNLFEVSSSSFLFILANLTSAFKPARAKFFAAPCWWNAAHVLFQITNRPIGGAVYHSQFPRLKCERYLHPNSAEALFALHLHNIIHFIDFVLEGFFVDFYNYTTCVYLTKL